MIKLSLLIIIFQEHFRHYKKSKKFINTHLIHFPKSQTIILSQFLIHSLNFSFTIILLSNLKYHNYFFNSLSIIFLFIIMATSSHNTNIPDPEASTQQTGETTSRRVVKHRGSDMLTKHFCLVMNDVTGEKSDVCNYC